MKEQWIKLFINFIFGGTIVASVSYIGTYMNPSMHFMKQNGKSNKYISKFVLSCTYAFILLLICTFLISHYLKHDESERILPAIVKATIGWILCSILFYYSSYKYFMN